MTLRELRAVGVAAVAIQLLLAAFAGAAAVAASGDSACTVSTARTLTFALAASAPWPIASRRVHMRLLASSIALAVAACSGHAPDIAVPWRRFSPSPTPARRCSSSGARSARHPMSRRAWRPTAPCGGTGSRPPPGLRRSATSALLAIAAVPTTADRRPVAALCLLATAAAAALAARFATRPTTRASRWIEALSGIWLVTAYLAVGIVALAARQ